ncbi:putative RNA-directed DNA polymerase from transposon X-element [Trichonephila clavipes]|nr:putative RNA-directed DNA polymerase from transposon X-element [Trichonephila clavipes]
MKNGVDGLMQNGTHALHGNPTMTGGLITKRTLPDIQDRTRECWTIYRDYLPEKGTAFDSLHAYSPAKPVPTKPCPNPWLIFLLNTLTFEVLSQQLWRKVKAANGLYREFNIPILETSTALFSSPLDVANLIGTTFASVSSSDSYSPAFQATKNRLERTPINFRCRQPLPYNCDFDMFELKSLIIGPQY